jgi:hypothetical protein
MRAALCSSSARSYSWADIVFCGGGLGEGNKMDEPLSHTIILVVLAIVTIPIWLLPMLMIAPFMIAESVRAERHARRHRIEDVRIEDWWRKK